MTLMFTFTELYKNLTPNALHYLNKV